MEGQKVSGKQNLSALFLIHFIDDQEEMWCAFKASPNLHHGTMARVRFMHLRATIGSLTASKS